LGASGVAEKRSRASSRIVVGRVGKERPGANCRIQLAHSVAPERKETNCSIETTTRKAKKSALPFSGIAAKVASVRSWNNRLQFWQ
jgi:hypothetical protein